MIVFAVVVACPGLGGTAHADTTVKVLESFPSGDQVTLARNQNYYVRLAYATDTPVRIWARPYFHGKPADAGSNPSQTYVGNGETFGWFFFSEPGGEVDEIRIQAGDGTSRATPVVATLRVHVVGGSVAAEAAEPDWVSAMKQRAATAQRAEYKKRMSTPPSVGDFALFGGFMLSMLAIGLAAFAAPAWGLWRWRGGWRIGAVVPAAWMAFVVLRIMADGARDPTSHNLWPFEILQAGALSLVMMGVLLVARRLAGAASR
jgi:hypothetical protein